MSLDYKSIMIIDLKVCNKLQLVTRVQYLDEAICILLHTNAVGKGINPLVLSSPSTMGKIVGQAGFFSIGLATRLGEERLNSNQLYSA